jgi:hypothetical protein
VVGWGSISPIPSHVPMHIVLLHVLCIHIYMAAWTHTPPPPLEGPTPPYHTPQISGTLRRLSRAHHTCVVVYRHMRRKSYRQRACHHEQCSPRAALFCLQLRFGEPYPTRQLSASYALKKSILFASKYCFMR